MNFPAESPNFYNPDVVECLKQHRIVTIYGFIGERSNKFETWKKIIDNTYKRHNSIIALINSEGGNVGHVYALERYIANQRAKGKKFYTLGNECASAALEAAMVGDPDGIYLRPSGILEYHTTVSSRDEKSEDLRKRSQERILKVQMPMLEKIARRTGKSIEFIIREASADTRIGAQRALSEHYIDEIYSGPIY